MITQKSNFEVMKVYNEKYYGSWYIKGTIENTQVFDQFAYKYQDGEDDHFQYAYLYDQESVDYYHIGYAKQDFFELCHNQIVVLESVFKNEYI